MKKPAVSIIIPTYNRSHLLGETLESVIEQTYKNWECLVIDDGSEDYTGELMEFYCEKDSRINYHERPNTYKKGANSCRNFGFDISSGDFVNWFDSDDVMMNSFIEKRLVLFTDEISFVISSGYYVDENLKNEKEMPIDLSFDLFKGIIMGKQIIITNSILFRRSFLTGKQLFSDKVTRGEETEFFSRLFFQIKKDCYIILNSPLFFYRQHADTKTERNKLYVKKYKESSSFIASENIKRSIIIKDVELITLYYKQLVILFLQGLDNSHYSNSKFAFTKLLPVLWGLNRKICIEFFFIGIFLLGIRKGSYRLGKRYREAELF